jgi:hypothetical protein
MTEEKIQYHDCSWCAFPGATHEGGFNTEDGTVDGYFCNRSCFESWKRWMISIMTYKKLLKERQAKKAIENV